MRKRAGGDRNGYNGDAFVEVRTFLEKVGERAPTKDEIQEIKPALESIYDTYARLRSMAPPYRDIDLSDHVWGLMERIGKKRRYTIKNVISRAAGLL